MTASTTPVGLNSRHKVLQSGRDIPWEVAEETTLVCFSITLRSH